MITGTVVTTEAIIREGYVAVRGETIAAIGQGTPPPATETISYGESLILPGLVDGHMHTSSSTGWPGIETASRSAAAGGVTTCCDMPYDVPQPVTDAALLHDKIGWVERTSHVDMALYGTITKTGGVHAIPELAAGGISAFKLSTYEYDAVRFPRIDHPTMLAAFHAIAKTGLPCAIHNEDQELVETLTAEARAAGRTDPIMHCRTRPPLAESMADLEIFEMALETGAHVHIAHSSIARGFDLAREFRQLGAKTTGEACIHYLCMTEDDIVRLKGFGKCNPPFRTAAEVERMWTVAAGRSDRIYIDRPRALAARAQDIGRHLRLWRRSDGIAEFCAADVHVAGGARSVADADGDVLRRTQRETARHLAEEGRDPGWFGCRSCRAGARRFRVR